MSITSVDPSSLREYLEASEVSDGLACEINTIVNERTQQRRDHGILKARVKRRKVVYNVDFGTLYCFKAYWIIRTRSWALTCSDDATKWLFGVFGLGLSTTEA